MKKIVKIINYILSTKQDQIIKDIDLEYLLWISNIYLKIKNIPGHIAEIGVGDGRNSVLLGLKVSNLILPLKCKIFFIF